MLQYKPLICHLLQMILISSLSCWKSCRLPPAVRWFRAGTRLALSSLTTSTSALRWCSWPKTLNSCRATSWSSCTVAWRNWPSGSVTYPASIQLKCKPTYNNIIIARMDKRFYSPTIFADFVSQKCPKRQPTMLEW